MYVYAGKKHGLRRVRLREPGSVVERGRNVPEACMYTRVTGEEYGWNSVRMERVHDMEIVHAWDCIKLFVM